MKQQQIRIAFYPVEGTPEVRTIDNELEAMQALVGGYIEAVPLAGLPGLDAFCDEEGLLKDRPLNPHFTPWGWSIAGDVFIARLNPKTGDQIDLTEADLQLLGLLTPVEEEGELLPT
jgi:hypothetical protein